MPVGAKLQILPDAVLGKQLAPLGHQRESAIGDVVGRGAGDMPTAVSVVADLVDVARARVQGEPGLMTRGIQLKERALLPQHEVETRIARALLSGDILPGATITVDVADGELAVRWRNPVTEEAEAERVEALT